MLDAEARVLDVPLPPSDSGDNSEPAGVAGSNSSQQAGDHGLNSRQQRAWSSILERGEVTRAEYEHLVGGDIPSRTAVYDLKELVRKGMLIKAGRGPATKYLVAAQMVSWHADDVK